ncbi:Hypothetical protein NGAL_HAMBI2605_56270 [Neorhizobium galegae bv. orientalis]|nr:Hypothetical protein NGAL_HAMBI2605_56270 [Neorhizobium galegae bv. orientalis]
MCTSPAAYLDVRFRSSNPLGGFRSPAEIEFGVVTFPTDLYARPDGRCRHLKMVSIDGDLFFGPEPADQPHEFLGAGLTVRLIAFAIAVSGKVVLA